MTPEISSYFHLEMSNVCNFCCMAKEPPTKCYVSKKGIIEPWDDSKGSPQVAKDSYMRLRKLAFNHILDAGVDVRQALSVLDVEIGLTLKAEQMKPVDISDVKSTALAIDRMIKQKDSPK